MTEEQLRKKCETLFKRIADDMPKELDKLVKSGAVDYESADDDYILPQKLVCAILKEEQFQVEKPFHGAKDEREWKKEVTNYYSML